MPADSVPSPLELGSPVPPFTLPDHDGTPTQVPAGIATVLVFYRGFW